MLLDGFHFILALQLINIANEAVSSF